MGFNLCFLVSVGDRFKFNVFFETKEVLRVT